MRLTVELQPPLHTTQTCSENASACNPDPRFLAVPLPSPRPGLQPSAVMPRQRPAQAAANAFMTGSPPKAQHQNAPGSIPGVPTAPEPEKINIEEVRSCWVGIFCPRFLLPMRLLTPRSFRATAVCLPWRLWLC